MTAVERHFVTFYSPGTFVSEATTKEIDSWDIEKAKELARGIVERYGATPYAFVFATRSRGDDDLDSKQTARSGQYFLGGSIETLEDVEARNDPAEVILRSNMRGNGISRIIRSSPDNPGWRWTQEFHDGDVRLDCP